jgi:high-affinity nickel permease
MTDRKLFSIVFILSFLFLVLSVIWFVLRIATGSTGLIFTEISDQIILIIGFISFFIAFLSVRKLLEDIRYEINEIKEIEKNVRDFYRYEQLMNPSDIDN